VAVGFGGLAASGVVVAAVEAEVPRAAADHRGRLDEHAVEQGRQLGHIVAVRPGEHGGRGMPRPSVRRWRLRPHPLLSVGLAPVACGSSGPLFLGWQTRPA